MRHCTQCGAATPDDARFCPRCGAPVGAPGGNDPMLGKVIADRYLLVEKVGQGGSGTIYRGEHTTLRKRVAVKVLHAQLTTDDTALERFRREATTVAELDNDHILQVLDFGRTEDNRLFFAMELLEGEPLTKVIERERMLPVDRAIDILTQTAEALTEAHGLGYVHRDLRPRNIFLTNKRGRADFVKLLDFGLAKLVLPDVEAKQTAMGMTFGDPRYMSPEQARGEALDRRSDIYSLGAMAFEMLTGTPPYTGSGTFEILQQHLDAPVPRVRVARADCPEWLDAVVQRALAKQPDGRFSTVTKLLESLKVREAPAAADAAEKAAHARLAAEKPAPAGPPGPVQSMGPPATAAVDQLPPKAGSPRDTLALTTLAPKNGPQQQAARAKQDKKDQKDKSNGSVPAATSGSVEVVRTPLKAPEAPANVPSVVVESSSQEKTMPAKVPVVETPAAPAASAAPAAVAVPAVPVEQRPTVQRLNTPAPATEPSRRQKDPTGEWFSSDSQPIKIVPGATYDDDLDELPKKNRGPMIIAGVTGGLTLVGVIVIALLPKPQHKPLRGEEATSTAPSGAAATAPSGAAAAPSGAAAAPSGTAGATPAPSGEATTPSGVATAPTPATGATTAPSGAATAPSGAATAPSGATTAPSGAATAPSGVAAAPTGARAKPEVVTPKATPPAPARPVIAAAPAPKPAAVVTPLASKPPVAAPPVKAPAAVAKSELKEPPARVEKAPPPVKAEKPERAEKPTRVASAAPVEKTAPPDKRKKDKAPEAFKDPFAADAPKATAPSASESAQAEFFVKLGRQKLAASDLGSAAANFNKAREYDTRSHEAVAGLGEVAFEQGDYAGAVVHLKQALKLAPNRSRYLVLLGQTYYKLGKPKEAVSEYKKALRVDPNNQEAQHSLEVAERKLQSGG